MKLLRILGFPIALVYGLVVRIRNYFYDVGIFRSKQFDTPTICVGNLSLGGTGKTPMVEFLVSALQKTHKIAVLSRGYRRRSTGFVLANAESTVEQLGDEPYQIFKKFDQISLAVDADRCNGIKLLERNIRPDLIILDDAFQHRKLSPTFSILLTAYDKLYCEDFFLPTGTLRDARNQARRANIIVVTKCPENVSEADKNAVLNRLGPKSDQKVLFSYLDYNEVLKGPSAVKTIDALANTNITLVTGIAKPEPLVAYLIGKGLKFEHLRFKDHHSYTQSEIDDLNSREIIVTTEKDYSRLQGKVTNLAYIQINHRFIDDGKQLLLEEIGKITRPSS